MKNILIIGCGLTGATLAYLHKQLGDSVTVFEKRNHIGGNIYTENINGICAHKYGAHIFHTSDTDVWNFVNKFTKFNKYTHQVKSRYNGKLYSLPINMNTFNEFFNITSPTEIKQEHIDYIKKCLFYGYTAKQWGKSINEINKDVLNRLPYRETYNNNYFDDIYQGIPEEGYTKMIERMLEGVYVKLNISMDKNYDYSQYNIVYNTSPIDMFMGYELGELEYRSLRFVNEWHDNITFQDYPVINEADINVPYTRIIEHKHFNNTGQPGTILTMEYPIKYDKYKNEPYYSINNDINDSLHDKYIALAKNKYPNMIFCGRLGTYKYYDMDDAIREAINIVCQLSENYKSLTCMQLT